MFTSIIAICLGIGLSAASGFRVFVPLLAASIASKAGLYHFSAGFDWMGSWTAMIIFGTATVAEIAAYYIPFVDNLLDHITTPMAVAAGTLLTTSYLGADMSPALKWGLGLIVGGGAAGIVQAGTGLLRLGSSATTGGLANPVVSTAENGMSITTSVLALLIPIIVAVAVVILLFYIVNRLVRFRRRKRPTADDLIV